MKAAVFAKHGLELRDVSQPQPKPGELGSTAEEVREIPRRMRLNQHFEKIVCGHSLCGKAWGG